MGARLWAWAITPLAFNSAIKASTDSTVGTSINALPFSNIASIVRLARSIGTWRFANANAADTGRTSPAAVRRTATGEPQGTRSMAFTAS